jgi:tetratricopeptide (TPR) repeat protein
MAKKINFHLLMIIACLLCLHVTGQQNKIDSLLTLVKTDINDTNKLYHYYRISVEYESLSDFSNGLDYGSKTLSLAERILKEKKPIEVLNRAKKLQARTYTLIGIIHSKQGNNSDALYCLKSAVKINKDLDNKKDLARAFMILGIVYTDLGNYPEALQSHFASLNVSELLNDQASMSYTHSNIGVIYFEQENYSEALKNFNSCLESAKILNDKIAIASSYINIGNSHKKMNNDTAALRYCLLANKINDEIGNQGGLSTSYNILGDIYISRKKYDDALFYYLKSLKIKESLKDNSGIAASYCGIGSVLIQKKKFAEAQKYLLKAKELSLQMGAKEFLKDVYSLLTVLDSVNGNYKGAFSNHKLYILYRDSLDNEETRKKTIQSQMTFDFEKKEAIAVAEHKKELENQEVIALEKSRKQSLIIAFVIAGFLLVLVFAGFIFRSLRTTRKQKNIIELQKNIVEDQKNTVELQKHIVEEKQKEIIDSINYAKRIQQSQLPTEKYINKNLNRLQKN